MLPTDQELVERTKRGDNTAFGELWARHERQVLALCRRYLAGPHRDPAIDEQDLATEAFIRALHRLDRYEDRSPAGIGFQCWLLEIAKRLCLRFLAKQRRRRQWCAAGGEDPRETPDVGPTAAQVVVQREALRAAAQAINALPERYRLPFKLSLEEHSQKEIAAALGISRENAAKRVQRARRLLRPRLAGLFEVEVTAGMDRRAQERSDAGGGLRRVEQALTQIVSDTRIVAITLPSGGEVQLCLRVDRRLARRGPEIEARRARLRQHPRAWKPRLELAEICYHSGRWDEARQEYQEALRRQPGCAAAALRLGEMLEQEEKPAEAAAVYRQALRQKPPPAVTARLRARLLAAAGRDEGAVKAFRRALRLDPREKTGYYGLHEVLGRLSRYEEQLENLARLREIDPDDLFGLTQVYTPCARLDRFDAARPLLERAVAVDPHSPLALKCLFQARMNLGLRDAETGKLAERLVEIAPELGESWSQLAWFYAELGRHEDSLAVLGQFVNEHPDNAEAHAALAWRYHYLRCGEEEWFHARRAYALEPRNRHVCWTLLAACGPALDHVPDAEALRYAAEIADRLSTDAMAMLWLSRFYCVRRREAEALECARRAVALNPAWIDAQAQLAAVYSAFERWEAAAEIYQPLVERPEGRRWRSAWGVALKALRDPRADTVFAALCAERRAAGDDLGCGAVYEVWGKREEAIAAFQRCLSPPARTIHLCHLAREALRRLEVEAL